MTLRYLLDTNVISEALRVRPDDAVLARLRAAAPDSLCTCAPVWSELVFGCARLPDGPKRRALHEYLHDVVRATLPILAYDDAAASWHAHERARLTAIGKTPPFVDGMIASIAHTRGLVLVTNNVADMQGFEGLVVERWHAPKPP